MPAPFDLDLLRSFIDAKEQYAGDLDIGVVSELARNCQGALFIYHRHGCRRFLDNALSVVDVQRPRRLSIQARRDHELEVCLSELRCGHGPSRPQGQDGPAFDMQRNGSKVDVIEGHVSPLAIDQSESGEVVEAVIWQIERH